jgi:drug/metabolite transporter (DMT)-like permease
MSNLGVLAMFLASFGFSWGFIIVKAVGLAPASVAFYRLMIGAGVLSSVALVRRERWFFSGPVVVAGVCFGLHQLLFIAASQTTSIALVTLIGALQPLLVALAGRKAVGEEVAPGLYGCALLALAGVGLVMFANRGLPSTSTWGLSLSVLNLFAYTAYFLACKRARREGVPTLTLTAASLAIALVPVAPMLVLAPPHASAWQVGLLALMAVVPGNGHLLVNWAHPRVSATLGSLILSLVPVFASCWAHLLFDEPFGVLHAVGTLLTLVAVELGRRSASAPALLPSRGEV